MHQSTQTISVIDRQAIEQTNPAGLLDIAAEAPGVTVSRSGGIGGQVVVRGLNSNDFRVPMFVDGDRFHGRNTLQFMLIPPEDVERVEVIRGPDSIMFGSEAMGGLVNVITRRASGDRFADTFRFTGGTTSFTYGSAANTTNGHVDFEGAGGGYDARIAITGRRADDYQTPQGAARNSDYQTLGGSFSLGYSPDPQNRIELSARDESVSDGRAGGIGGAPGYPYTQVREATMQVRTGRLGYVGNFDSGWFSRVDTSVYVEDFYTKLTTATTTSATQRSDANSYVIGPTVVGGKANGTLFPWFDVTTTVGMDWFREMRPGAEASSTTTRYATGTSTAVSRYQTVPDATQTNVGAFVHNEWKALPSLTFTVAGRVDWFNTTTDIAPLPSPRLLTAYQNASDSNNVAGVGSGGVSWRVAQPLELIATVGNSFRMPTTAEMFGSSVSGTGFVIPNPSLKPERGINVEGGTRWHFPRATVTFTAFHTDYDDFILTTPVTYLGTSSTQRQNISKAEFYGAEGEARWQVNDLVALQGNVSTIRAINTTTGRAIPYVAPLYGRASIEYAPLSSAKFTGTLAWAAPKDRIDPTQEYKTAGYAILNLYAALDLRQLVSDRLGETSLGIGVENLFDTSYRSAATYANVVYNRSPTNPLLEPGRNITATLRHRF